jgi:Predicted acyl-CoA transferases/carnitine dehydratase
VHPSIEPFATYRTGDGELMICAGNDAQFSRLCGALGIEDDPRFATNADRVANRDALRPLLEAALAARPAREWRDVLSEAGVSAGPVQTIEEAFSLGRVARARVVDETRRACGRSRSPPASRRPPATVRRRPPDLNEHEAELRVSDTEGV